MMRLLMLTVLFITPLANGWAEYYRPVAELPETPDVEKRDGPQVEAVYEYEREDYVTEGTRAGSFNVRPQVSVDETYMDNIFADETNTEGDFITTVKPTLTVESDWNNHAVAGQVRGTFGFYADNEAENFEDFGAGVNGRYDILRETAIKAGFDVDRKHEDRGSPDDQNGRNPTQYTETSGSVMVEHAPGKLALLGGFDARRLDYKNVLTSTGAEINNNRRDRNERGVTLRVGYELQPEYEAFAKVRLTDSKYDTLESGVDRDSDGYEVTVGTAVNFTGKVRGEAYVGYFSREYDDATLSGINKPTFGGNVLWNINQLTSVSASLQRSIQDTLTAGASGYVSTDTRVRVEHELRRHVLLSADAGYTTSDYEGGVPEREDEVISFGIGGRYLINRQFSVGVNYGYEDLDSNIVGQDYTRNRVTVNLTAKL